MTILLGWKWGAGELPRDVYTVTDGFERWQVEPVAVTTLAWRSQSNPELPLFNHFTAVEPVAPSTTAFALEPLLGALVRRLPPRELDVDGGVLVTVVTSTALRGLGVQLEVAPERFEAMMRPLGAVFAEAELVLYSPADDQLVSRGAVDSAVLSAPDGHQWQPAWADVTRALQQLDDEAIIVYENQRGDFIQLAGGKRALTVECRIANDSVPHAVAGRPQVSPRRAKVQGAGVVNVFEHEVLTVDDAFHLFKSFFDDGERSPWFSWRPVES